MEIIRTLAIVKPDAVDKTDEIEDIVRNEGIEVSQKKPLQLDVEQASDLYAEHAGRPYFRSLVDYMMSGPVTAMVLRGENVIEKWRTMIGPTSVLEAKAMHPESIRAKYGSGEFKNAVHGSSSEVCAEREIAIFFPDLAAQTTVTGQAAKAYLADTVNPVLLKGLTELCKQKPLNPIAWLADWLLVNNPNKQKTSDQTTTTTAEETEYEDKDITEDEKEGVETEETQHTLIH